MRKDRNGQKETEEGREGGRGEGREEDGLGGCGSALTEMETDGNNLLTEAPLFCSGVGCGASPSASGFCPVPKGDQKLGLCPWERQKSPSKQQGLGSTWRESPYQGDHPG